MIILRKGWLNMTKTNEINKLANRLFLAGMEYELAKKNLLECDQYFIDKLGHILKEVGI